MCVDAIWRRNPKIDWHRQQHPRAIRNPAGKRIAFDGGERNKTRCCRHAMSGTLNVAIEHPWPDYETTDAEEPLVYKQQIKVKVYSKGGDHDAADKTKRGDVPTIS